MENIKFILKFAVEVPISFKVIGDCVYFVLESGNRVKAYCDEHNVIMEVINKSEGKVDSVKLPFRNYFQPVQCSEGAPTWYQHIDNGKWNIEHYKHVLPKLRDYQNVAEAMENYIAMFE